MPAYLLFHYNFTNSSFTKPKMLNEVAALEIIQDHSVYYKIRWGTYFSEKVQGRFLGQDWDRNFLWDWDQLHQVKKNQDQD